ncbi:MAG: Peptidase [Thermoleophilia bacterium]|nr:Peptidase [Thermoleophilia bacterium]
MNRPFRRSGLLVTLSIFIALPTAVANAGLLEERLANTRADAKDTRAELSIVDKRQQVVVRQVTRLNRRLAELEVPLHRLEAEVAGLDDQITKRERRIVELRADRERQKQEIKRLNLELDSAQDLLATRVVTAYKSGDTGVIEQLAGADDLEELFRREEALAQIVGLDDRVIDRITDAERAVRVKRARNFELRRQIREDILAIDADKEQVDAKRDEAQAARDEVASVRAERDKMLESLTAREENLGAHLDDLQEDAKVLQDVIKNGTSTYSGAIGGLSASGLIWPVSGPVVSPFGPRWGRMHEGIDIAIGAGNPISAAAAGVVTYAGWMSGYGNMVVIQHANGIGTGYGHQSQIAVTQGQLVGQGQLIGFVGCTGHCFGDHVHFEVYNNGTPTDPMPYLS